MKRFIWLFFALVLAAPQAHASKARLAALQFAGFYKDPQNIFLFTHYAADLGQYMTLELGPTGTFSTGVHAEGGFAKKWGESVVGAYLGHQDPALNAVYAATGVSEQRNPLFIYLARGKTGFGLNLSFSDVRTTASKEFSVGGTFGASLGALELGTSLILYSKGEAGAAATEATPVLTVSAALPADEWKPYSTFQLTRWATGGVSTADFTVLAGLQNHSLKVGQKGFFFFGAELGYAQFVNRKVFNLPLYLGIETDVASWATIRGSLSQSLIGTLQTGAAPTDLNTNNTRVALGGGLRFGDFTLDGLLAVATSGALNSTAVLTSAALTYAF